MFDNQTDGLIVSEQQVIRNWLQKKWSKVRGEGNRVAVKKLLVLG